MAKEKPVRLTEVEKFYIKSNPESLSASDLAKKLKKPAEIIQVVLDEAAAELREKVKAEEESKKKKSDTLFRQNMSRPARKGKKIATAMTGTAAEVADAARKNNKAKQKAPHIYKPYADE